MKKSVLFLLFFISLSSLGQMVHPTKWTFKSVEKKDGNVELQFHLEIDNEWHVYSQFTPEGGPLPMIVTFEPSDCYSRVGKVAESKPVIVFDSIFGINTHLFFEEADFKQVIKLNDKNCKIKGNINYQACIETCVNLDTTFEFVFGTGKAEPKVTAIVPEKDTASAVVSEPVPTKDDFIPKKETQLEPGCVVAEGGPKSYRYLL